jgi:ABC-type Na+ efflux pump permease subunit
VNGRRIRAVARRELRDYRRNRFVIGTMVALPLFFIIIPVASVLAINASSPEGAVQTAVASATLVFFLVPLILPTVIAAYAVVGERDQGTLEPVLTTPVQREELLIGKALAAVVPTVATGYGLIAVFLIMVRARGVPAVEHLVLRPAQVVGAILFMPLLATFSIWVALAISARASDVRVAQQLSSLAMVPMILLLSLLTFGVVSPTVTLALRVAAVLVVIDLLARRLVSRMFDRERLLTRYGKT